MAKTDEQPYAGHFIALVTMLYNNAMQQMGKLMNPLTGGIEKNLGGAKASIDILSMLKEKTEGNLTKEEQMLITSSLANLQMNYVDEVKRESEETKKAEEEKTKEKQKTKESEKEEKKDKKDNDSKEEKS